MGMYISVVNSVVVQSLWNENAVRHAHVHDEVFVWVFCFDTISLSFRQVKDEKFGRTSLPIGDHCYAQCVQPGALLYDCSTFSTLMQ